MAVIRVEQFYRCGRNAGSSVAAPACPRLDLGPGGRRTWAVGRSWAETSGAGFLANMSGATPALARLPARGDSSRVTGLVDAAQIAGAYRCGVGWHDPKRRHASFVTLMYSDIRRSYDRRNQGALRWRIDCRRRCCGSDDGETVRVGDRYFELETDKATTEVPAPAAGQLAIQVPDGQTVAVGSVVGRINTDVVANAEKPTAPVKEPTAAPPATAQSKSPEPLSPAAKPPLDAAPAQAEKRDDKTSPPVPASVDAVALKPSEQPVPSGQRESRQRMSPIRQRIAERLVHQRSPPFDDFNDARDGRHGNRSRYKGRFRRGTASV